MAAHEVTAFWGSPDRPFETVLIGGYDSSNPLLRKFGYTAFPAYDRLNIYVVINPWGGLHVLNKKTAHQSIREANQQIIRFRNLLRARLALFAAYGQPQTYKFADSTTDWPPPPTAERL